MAISKIHEKSLDSNSITESNISSDLITEQTVLAESANENDAYLLYDDSAAQLKKILSSNVVAVPTFTSISPTNIDESDSVTTSITITGSGFTEGSTASLVTAGGSLQAFDTVTRDSSTQLTCVVTNADLAAGDDPYGIQITNGKGFSTVSTGQLTFNGAPTWTTASGSLGNVYDSDRTTKDFTIAASDPDGGSVSFNTSLISGSLPAGSSITDNGDGTATIGTFDAVVSDTTSTFTIRTVDSASNIADRQFSITVKAPVTTTYSHTGSDVSFSIPSGLETLTATMWGASGGGGSGETYSDSGGAGGFATGKIDVSSMSSIVIQVGAAGVRTDGSQAGTPSGIDGAENGIAARSYPKGGKASNRSGYRAGNGGGRTAIFNGSVAHGNSLLIAGGGGGAGGHGGGSGQASNSMAGGNGGGGYTSTGDTSGAGYNYGGTRGTNAGTQTEAGSTVGLAGALHGGDRTGSNSGGAGGDGYYGGGQGGTHGGGGGGSGYYNSTYVSSQTLSATSSHSGKQTSINPPETSNSAYSSGIAVGDTGDGANGRLQIKY